MKRLFGAIPVISLLVAVVTSGVVTASHAVLGTWIGFVWAFLLLTAVLVYLTWCVWAWLILPYRLRPIMTPLLLGLVAGLLVGTTAFVVAVALILAAAVPTLVFSQANRPPTLAPDS